MGYVDTFTKINNPDLKYIDRKIDEVARDRVLYMPLYKIPEEVFFSRDIYKYRCVNSGSIWTPQGRRFNGANNYISMGNPSSLSFRSTDPLTFKWWIKPTDFTNPIYQMLYDKFSEATVMGFSCGAYDNTGKLVFTVGGGNPATNFLQVTSTAALTNAALQQIIITYNGSKTAAGVKMYVNGIAIAMTTITNTLTTTDVTNTINAQIGARNGANYPYNGVMALAEINFGKVFNPMEVYRDYLNSRWLFQ